MPLGLGASGRNAGRPLPHRSGSRGSSTDFARELVSGETLSCLLRGLAEGSISGARQQLLHLQWPEDPPSWRATRLRAQATLPGEAAEVRARGRVSPCPTGGNYSCALPPASPRLRLHARGCTGDSHLINRRAAPGPGQCQPGRCYPTGKPGWQACPRSPGKSLAAGGRCTCCPRAGALQSCCEQTRGGGSRGAPGRGCARSQAQRGRTQGRRAHGVSSIRLAINLCVMTHQAPLCFIYRLESLYLPRTFLNCCIPGSRVLCAQPGLSAGLGEGRSRVRFPHMLCRLPLHLGQRS